MYGKTTCKILVKSDKSFTPPIEQTFFKGICQKIQRKYFLFSFLDFSSYFVLVKCLLATWITLSDQYASFDTHIAILYDILCHMAYVIKCHKMAFYGIL